MITQPCHGAQIGQYGVMRQQRLVFGEVAELYDKARAAYPDALIDDVSGFAGADGVGLLYSAQAWHWVQPEVRYQKAAEVLAPGGTLALFWHRTRWQGEQLRDELESLYLRLVPGLHAKRPGFP